MSLVAVIGAGETGGAAARALALRGRFEVVRLIDDIESVARGKALDLMQSGPIRGCDTRVEGIGDLGAAGGAAAIILADPAGAGEWDGEPGLGVLRRLLKLGCLDRTVLICAGAGHRTLMQRAIDELKLPRRCLVGSAPEALAATARALVAVEARTASNQVTLTVIGDPPGRMVIPWRDASIAGHSVLSLLTPPQLRRLERRVRGLWPPGPNTLGTAAAQLAEASALESRRLFSAYVSLDRDNGTHAPVCAWPVSFGSEGVERITRPVLEGRDQVVVDEVLE
jgi:malate dehydrogenase